MASFTKIFECAKLLEVEETQPAAGGEAPTYGIDSGPPSSTIGIDLCSWKECSDHSVLVLFCNNGYLVVRVTLSQSGDAPLIKQMKWFESHSQHILDMTLDPLGEWLACACLDGALYLLPILNITKKSHRLVNVFGAVDDITIIRPHHKKAAPTRVVWWETMDDRHICITGSEVGEVTFFDMARGEEVSSVGVSGCIDHLLIAHQPDHSTHLLMGVRGGEWRRLLLEEHFHEAAGTSYQDAHASGFDVVPDDMVIKSFLNRTDSNDPAYEVTTFPSFSEFNSILTQDWRDQHFLTALNLQNFKMEIFSYDFDLLSSPLRTYQLVEGATGALLMDRMLFVISHNDEADPCSFTLSVMSSQRASISDVTSPTPHESNSIIQQFNIPSRSNLVGFYSTSNFSSQLATAASHDQSHDHPSVPTSNLGGCLVVTTSGVYQCRQTLSPEDIFLELILSNRSHERAEEFGITYRLDVCGLYQVAAKQELNEKHYSQALKLFELSRCPSSKIIESFSSIGRVPELVHYLHQLVYDDTQHASLLQPKQVQNVLLKCFIHECLRCYGQPEGAVMTDKFSQFLSEKFLYDQSVAMELLVQCGLKEQLFDLAKTHHKLGEALEKMVKYGATDISPSLQSSLASRQYVSSLTDAAKGLFLHQMTPANFVRLLYAKPSIIPSHLSHLHTILPQLDIPNLLRLSRLFDPSHNTIRPLLIKAHSHRHQSNSTGSLVSIAADGNSEGAGQGEESSPRLEAYIETFIITLIILNYRRKHLPKKSNSLLSLSPLRSAMSGTTAGAFKTPSSYTEGSQWVRGSTLSCGMNHAAVVANGNLYTWGSTKSGKLGHGDIEEEGKAAPLRVETICMLSIHVVSVSCGAEHTIALCQEGIFSWGSSSHGQLGHGDTLKKTRPVQIAALADKSIVSVVCGQYHSLALDDDNQVWSWGWGVHGQLGLRSVDDRSTPTHSSLLDNKQVSFIAAGYGHSAIVTAEGKVYTFGNGMYGQLGHGNTDKQSSPKIVEALADQSVYLLACGNFHTIVVTTDQKIFFWGKNFSRHKPSVGGPQGLKEYKRSRERQQTAGTGSGMAGGAQANTLAPQQISDVRLDDTVMQVSCGNHHSLLLTSAGSVYSWGSNLNGQLGLSHTGEVLQPKFVDGFDGQKIVAISTGDEFSLALDEKGVPWVWGKGDKGQLGIPVNDGHEASSHSRRATCLFKPRPISSIAPITDSFKSPRETSPDPAEPFLELDLGWELPDFAAIDSPHTPYGCKALNSALEHLHGYYRTSTVLWQCQDWGDWRSMTTIANIQGHWAQALRYALKYLVEGGGTVEALEQQAITLTHDYLRKFMLEHTNYLSEKFIREALDVLRILVSSWESHKFKFSSLEGILVNYLDSLAYPLNLILKESTLPDVSAAFHLAITQEVFALVSKGHPTPTDIIKAPDPTHTSTVAITGRSGPSEGEKSVKKLTIETSAGDVRLWVEILRNLTKDLPKLQSIQLSEPVLANLRSRAESGESGSTQTSGTTLVTFSCGHAYSQEQFQNQILPEFVERVGDFPMGIPQTLKQLQIQYKQLQCYPSACPHCVFQFLRKIQLEECPKVPIRPWNM